ncbi:MAG: hypothetical protein O3C12_09130 [Proteobacteria bacterium]|nr:hypothetical protein [Pseudomonadota bacterium]
MLAGVYNITIEQGSTFGRLISVEQPDLAADPTGQTFENYSLESHTARMHIRRTVESSVIMLALTTENGGIAVNPNLSGNNGRNNELSLSITAEQTGALTTSGVYDLEIISAGNAVSKVIRGDIVLIPEVTRP